MSEAGLLQGSKPFALQLAAPLCPEARPIGGVSLNPCPSGARRVHPSCVPVQEVVTASQFGVPICRRLLHPMIVLIPSRYRVLRGMYCDWQFQLVPRAALRSCLCRIWEPHSQKLEIKPSHHKTGVNHQQRLSKERPNQYDAYRLVGLGCVSYVICVPHSGLGYTPQLLPIPASMLLRIPGGDHGCGLRVLRPRLHGLEGPGCRTYSQCPNDAE